MTSAAKRCTRCGATKELDAFPRKGVKKDGSPQYDSWCHVCRKAHAKEYQKGRYKPVENRKTKYFPTCDACKFLAPCRVLVMGRLTRDVVVNGASTRIYLDPYCFVESTLHQAFVRVYAEDR